MGASPSTSGRAARFGDAVTFLFRRLVRDVGAVKDREDREVEKGREFMTAVCRGMIRKAGFLGGLRGLVVLAHERRGRRKRGMSATGRGLAMFFRMVSTVCACAIDVPNRCLKLRRGREKLS